MMEVGDPGVKAQEFLSAFPSFEALPTSLLTPCKTVRLLNHSVATRRGDDVLMVDVDQTGELPNRAPITPQLIGMDDLWDIVFSQQSGEEGLRRFGVPMPLKEDIEYAPVLVHGPPKPVSNTLHSRTHLVEMPPETPLGFPVT